MSRKYKEAKHMNKRYGESDAKLKTRKSKKSKKSEKKIKHSRKDDGVEKT